MGAPDPWFPLHFPTRWTTLPPLVFHGGWILITLVLPMSLKAFNTFSAAWSTSHTQGNMLSSELYSNWYFISRKEKPFESLKFSKFGLNSHFKCFVGKYAKLIKYNTWLSSKGSWQMFMLFFYHIPSSLWGNSKGRWVTGGTASHAACHPWLLTLPRWARGGCYYFPMSSVPHC